jgi:hypothetical protein
MSASECSPSNGRAASAQEVKCQSTFEAKSRVQARAHPALGVKRSPKATPSPPRAERGNPDRVLSLPSGWGKQKVTDAEV